MDLWVVAAATGAGYIAKYWKSLSSKQGEETSSQSSNLMRQIWDQSTPLQRLALKQLDRNFGFSKEEKGGFPGDTGEYYETRENYNLLSSTGFFPPGLCENESSQGKSKYCFSDISMHLRGSKFYGNFLEPLDSVESCLEAQLCRECVRMEEEEYVYSSLPSPPPAVRPLLLPDGHRTISRDVQKPPRRLPVLRNSGFSNGKVIFVLGISIGVIFTTLASKKQVQNLNKLIMETESLVQDINEELEMKEQFNSTEINGDEALDHHQAEKSEAMNEIEAELEAELERLEINLRSSSLQNISPGVGLDDPDFVPEKATGEPCGFSDSDRDPDNAGNSAVSPRELSLHLHQVIESRLQARIMELETALENSQNKLVTLEMESRIPWRDLYSEAESSSMESSTFIDKGYENGDS